MFVALNAFARSHLPREHAGNRGHLRAGQPGDEGAEVRLQIGYRPAAAGQVCGQLAARAGFELAAKGCLEAPGRVGPAEQLRLGHEFAAHFGAAAQGQSLIREDPCGTKSAKTR